jgi:hypothetical protein
MRTPETRGPGIGLKGTLAAVALLFVCGGAGQLLAADFESDFDGLGKSWQVHCREADARLTIHERRRDVGHRGGAELIRLKVARDNVPLRFEHDVPVAQVLDELEAKLWIRSDRAGAVLALRIGFRGLTDPETGTPLSTIVTGDPYLTPGQWQQLTCRTSDKAVNDQLRLLRARKRVTIDPTTMFVDRVIIGCNLSSGAAELLIDDLTVGPIVPVAQSPPSNRSVTPTVAQDSDVSSAVPVEFRLHRLRVEGKPFLPRIAVHHNERPEALAAAGINVAWVSDLEATAITAPLRRQGIWLTAIPPFAKDNTGEPLDSEDASLLPFAPSSSSALFWMMGARITATGRPRLQSWTNQVRDADRAFKRPLAADVADDERLCSRHLDLLGISRHVMNSEVTLLDYRESLVQKRDRAWPGTLCWTWIQTEPSPELMDLAPATGATPLLEPEQIRAQVYAALAAGCRGMGYWTTTPLDGEGSAARERLLALTQLNLELALLEPWLATGSSVQLIPFTIDARHAEQPAPSMTRSLLGGKATGKKPESSADKQRERELTAALIRSEFGALLLPMWLENRSQFVPGQLAANNATIIVPGGGETASAWEITTTGRLQNLARETVAGGIKIVLPRFDQTAAILITSDQSVVEQLNQRISATQDRSAAACVELSQLKLERIRQIDQQLQQLGVGLPEAQPLLAQAQQHTNSADMALRQQQYQSARQHAADAMQLARMLQRAHWENAVKKLPSPVVSPYAVCFQTLPAHWKLMRGVSERSLAAHPNKLPSGEFEDLDTLIAAGWRHEQRAVPGVQSAAELHPSAKQGQYSLRLAAQPAAGEPPPISLNKIPVTVVSPPLSVHAGQVVRISGWVKLPQAVLGSLDGATIHDSLLGKTGAWRVKAARDWQRFELLRVVPESQELTVTISLHGLGELAIDDLQIVAFSPPAEVAESPSSGAPAVKPTKFSSLDALDLRRLNPLPKRK